MALATCCRAAGNKAFPLPHPPKNMLIRNIYLKWAERHTHRLNLILHLAGIPLTIAALPVLLFYSPAWALVLFTSGYTVQFLGHAIEGNKSGEQLLCEKLLRRARPPSNRSSP
ncbi:MAG: DUF962 domain-containing protein [Candidatus Aureabacteria bacterium]|nr:DUF962 domain-containing protein [Candidatus Auribacterota bacterium]